jgi:hypothetical protein
MLLFLHLAILEATLSFFSKSDLGRLGQDLGTTAVADEAACGSTHKYKEREITSWNSSSSTGVEKNCEE